jgi:hypothetical protein
MPNIPKRRQAATINESVGSTPGDPSGGRTEQALAQLGGTAAAIGESLLQKRKQAEDSDFAFTKSMQDAEDLNHFVGELKKTTPESGDGYYDSIKQFTDERIRENQEAAPSSEASSMYLQRSGRMFSTARIHAENEEAQMRLGYQKKNIDDSADALSKGLIENPNDQHALGGLARLHEGIFKQVGTLYSPEEAKQKFEDVKGSVAKNYFKGLEVTGKYDLALQLLNVNAKDAGQQFDATTGVELDPADAAKLGLADQAEVDHLSFAGAKKVVERPGAAARPDIVARAKVAEGLTAEEQGALIARFQGLMKDKAQRDVSDLRQSVDDLRAHALTGGQIEDGEVKDLMTRAMASGLFERNEPGRLRILGNIDRSVLIGNVLSEVHTMKPADMANLDERIDRQAAAIASRRAKQFPGVESGKYSSFMAEDREQVKSAILTQAHAALQARAADPKAYVDQYLNAKPTTNLALAGKADEVQNVVADAVAKQQAIGISKPRVLSKSEAVGLVDMIQNTQNEAQAEHVISSLGESYGGYTGQVMNDLIDQGKLDPKYRVVNFVGDQPSRRRALGLIKNGEPIKKAYEKEFPENLDELTKQVSAQFSPYAQSLTQADPSGGKDEEVNSMRDLVLTAAAQAKLNNRTLSDKKAIESGMELIRQTYGDPIEVDNSSFIVPNRVFSKSQGAMVPVNKVLVEAAARGKFRKEALQGQLLLPPADQFKDIPVEEVQGAFLEQVKQTGRWITNRDQTGMMLVYTQGKYGEQPVLRKDGKPYEIQFEDVNATNDPEILRETTVFGRLNQRLREVKPVNEQDILRQRGIE